MSSTNAKGTTGVTAESYGALDASQVSNAVWMVRIPPKLGQIWNEAAEGTMLGELVFTKGGTVNGDGDQKKAKAGLKVHISQETLTEEHSDLPLEYTIEAMTKRVPVLHPFTRNPDGSVVLHGTVSHTANLQMSRSDERYRKLCKNRIMQTSVTSTRFVKPVEANELSVRKSHSAALTSSSKGFGSAVQQFGRKMMEQNDAGGEDALSGKKRKYEGQPTQSVVFELFSAQTFWSVKEMRQASGRPEKEIRQVLSEIAEFHRRGEHKGLWQLRNEFQKQAE